MSKGIRVICPDCADVVEHHCHTGIKKAVVDFLSWVPDTEGLATEELNTAFFAAAKEHGWTAEPDSFEQPFFGSQAWSYVLFGSKDTARSFHSRISELIRAVGLDENALQQEIYDKRARKKAEAVEQVTREQKRKDEKAQTIAFLQGDAPLEERIVKLDEILRKFAVGLKPYGDKDDGFLHLHDTLKRYYGGGINHEINTARISKLEKEVYEANHADPPEEIPREVRLSVREMRILGASLRRIYGKTFQDNPKVLDALRKSLLGETT